MKPRILIFSLAYFPFEGGAEVAIRNITDRLVQYDFDLVTVNLDGLQKREEQIGNVCVHRIGSGKISKYFFQFTACLKASKLNSANKYDLTWAMMANQAGMAAYFFKLFHPNIPQILSLQEGDPNSAIIGRTFFIWPLYLALYRGADYVQAISTFLADRAKKFGRKGPTEIVPNGVNVELFSKLASEEDISRLRTRLGAKLDTKYIVTTSRLVAKNGVDDIIASLVELPSNVELLVLGTGHLQTKLQSFAEKLGVHSRVHFVGHVPYEEIPLYLQSSIAFVRPSRSEGMGNSFVEAMVAGVPVIGTMVGGIPDFLIPGQTGWSCEVNNPHSIGQAVKYILDPANEEAVSAIRKKAQDMVEKRYDWQSVSGRMGHIFQQLIVNAHPQENN